MKWIFFSFSLFSASAFATTTLMSVTGASSHSALGEPGSVTIYAGMAGSNTGANTNSCKACGIWNCACNPNRISDNSPITFTFVSDSPTVSSSTLVSITDANWNSIRTFGTYMGAGEIHTIETTWNLVCRAAYATDCETAASDPSIKIIHLGIIDNKNAVDWVNVYVQILAPTSSAIDDCWDYLGGVCTFKIDSIGNKAILNSVKGDNGWPGETTAIRVFASKIDFIRANPILASFTQDLSVDEKGFIVDELEFESDRMTYFRIASVDRAGNLFNFISDSNILSKQGGACTSLMDYDPTGPCRYLFAPQK